MKESTKDIGWMYHIMPVKSKSDPKPYPPLSKIAGLGIFSDECFDEDIKVYNSFKSTDTPYQTLCKMGGLQDLLYHYENDVIKKPPVPYPRCDWFYVDDIEVDNKKMPDCTERKKYEFTVPDYMTNIVNKKKGLECVDEYIPIEKRKKKRKQKKLPDNRQGFSEYTKPPVKLTFAQRQYPSQLRISFPKHDVSKELEKSKNVMENFYVRDYDQYRKQWKEIKFTETLRNKNSNRSKFREMSKDYYTRLATHNNNRSRSAFQFG